RKRARSHRGGAPLRHARARRSRPQRARAEGAHGRPLGRHHLRSRARRRALEVAVVSGALSVILSGTMVAQTVRMTIPYACAATGGILSERSGIVNIALEGTLLASALASIAVLGASSNPVAGVVAGVA